MSEYTTTKWDYAETPKIDDPENDTCMSILRHNYIS